MKIRIVTHREHIVLPISKTSRLIMCKDTLGVYCKNGTEHTNTLCEDKMRIIWIKAGGICNKPGGYKYKHMAQ
jgi:hypothetical protein